MDAYCYSLEALFAGFFARSALSRFCVWLLSICMCLGPEWYGMLWCVVVLTVH